MLVIRNNWFVNGKKILIPPCQLTSVLAGKASIRNEFFSMQCQPISSHSTL